LDDVAIFANGEFDEWGVAAILIVFLVFCLKPAGYSSVLCQEGKTLLEQTAISQFGVVLRFYIKP